jgi:hypothetical protein
MRKDKSVKDELTMKQKLEQATSDRPGTFRHPKETRVKIDGVIVNALEIQKEGQANRYGYRDLRKRLGEMFGLSVYDPGTKSETMLVYKKGTSAKG